MITVRIPQEIKEYKEKLFLGLTVRQLIAVVIAFAICVPLYYFGRDYINEDLLSWIITGIAFPCAGIGFVKKNGMPFEKYVYTIIKRHFIYPQTTVYKTNNFFREAQIKAEAMDKLHKYKKSKRYRAKATLERAFLIEESERMGVEIDMDKLDDSLLTVRKPRFSKDPNRKKKKEKKEQVKKSKAQIAVEEVESKKKENPEYLPSKKEEVMLYLYGKELEYKRIKEIHEGEKDISAKNTNMKKRRKAKSYIPKSTQDDLPYIADYDEGLFEVDPNKYSKCYMIYDINYHTAKEEEAVAIFCKWGEFINYFSDDIDISVVLDNRLVSTSEKERLIFHQMKEDNYDIHRKEFNKVLKRQMVAGNNDIQKNKYVTVTIDADSPYEALLRFHKIDIEVINNLKKIGSGGKPMSTDDRLALLHDKMRRGREGEFRVNYDFLKEQGISSKDYVAPSSFKFFKDYFKIEDTYYKCMFLNNLPASLSDELIKDIMDCQFQVTTTLNIQPVAQDKALNIVKRQLTGMDANLIEAEKKAIRAGYSPETVNHDLRQHRNQAVELLDDLMNKNQKMFFVSIMLMVSADSLDSLNTNCEILLGKARAYTCQLQIFDNQQRDAFRVTMPFGVPTTNKLFVERTLTTESTAIFIPFSSQELFQIGGLYYGLNQTSKNLILCDRTKMKTPSGFILGSSGSGKSFAAKREMLQVLLADDKTNLLIIDPENEYTDFGKAFGATILNLSAGAENYINPMDMNENYGLDDKDDPIRTPLEIKKEKALRKKTEYLMSIIQCMLTDENNNVSIKPRQKTMIDRVIKRTYQNYLDHDFDENYIPTLMELQDEFDKEKTTEDNVDIAEAVEYFTRGSMNLFAHKSNLDFSNRFVIFSIRDLGKELKQISLLITLDFIWNRMISNFNTKVRTYCYVDEIHVLFQNSFSERYLQQLYKRGRKYGLVITGITQDIEELLRSDIAKTMISNSDFILMLNQSAENLKLLQDLLGISQTQSSYVKMAEEGCGLLFAEKTMVPFWDEFPSDSYLYTLMSTKFGEENDVNIDEFIAKLQAEQEKREKATEEKMLEKEKKVEQRAG